MYLILLFIALVSFLIWFLVESFRKDLVINISDNSVPLIHNSLNLAFLGPVEAFAYSRRAARVLGKSYRLLFFGRTAYNIVKARDAEKILGSSKHIKKSLIYHFLSPFLKEGLLTSNGDKWHSRRRLLTPAFHFNILQQFQVIFKEESIRLIDTLKQNAGKQVDVVPLATQFTLNTICETAMGVKLSELGNDGIVYRKNIYEVGKKLLYRLLKPWLFFDFIYSLFGYRRELDVLLKPIHQFTRSIVEKRKINFMESVMDCDDVKTDKEKENIYIGTKKKRFAMLDTMIKAQHDGLIDDEGIYEETDTFTFEGHDTTSSAMTFSLLLLAHHPEAQEKILEEVQEVSKENESGNFTIDDFNKMNYLDRVLKECLRIYPPVTFISREFTEDFIHDGITYRKGDACHIHIYDINRDPDEWKNPEYFDPDRFLPEACEGRNNFSFVSFSAGKRNCIGQRFAMSELKVMLTEVVKNFKIIPVTKCEELVFISDLVLRNLNPVEMIFIPRE